MTLLPVVSKVKSAEKESQSRFGPLGLNSLVTLALVMIPFTSAAEAAGAVGAKTECAGTEQSNCERASERNATQLRARSFVIHDVCVFLEGCRLGG